MSDIEKHGLDSADSKADVHGGIVSDDAAIVDHHAVKATWLTRSLRKVGFTVEERGIERVPPDNRPHTRTFDLVLLWNSINWAVTNYSLGVLGPAVFGLGLVDSCLTVLFFVGLGTFFTAYFSTFGPKTGLRQMSVSRYAFGWYGNKVMAFLNSMSCLGWSAVNVTVGGQVLAALSDNKLPTPGGIVILAVFTCFIALVGYKYVHTYEQWAWIPVVIVYFIVLGEGASQFTNIPMGSGSAEAGNVLSFGCALVGGSLGWATFASDYNVNMPVDTPSWKVFTYTFIGLIVPQVLVECLGAACGTAISTNDDWAAAYDENSIGGLLGAILAPLHGGGKFFLVILALSIIGGNLPNSYSLALSFQNVSPIFLRVPRFLWSTIGTVIYVGIGIAAAYDFADSLTTFMSILSYFLAIYTTVVLEEHLIFRRGSFANYDLDAWDDKERLPLGFAGMLAFCFGVMGAVLGMAQLWYLGVIGRQIGDPDYGGDIAFELAACFAGIVYPIARYFEKKYLGR